MSEDEINYEKLNKDVESWAKQTNSQIIGGLGRLQIDETGHLEASIKVRTSKSFGVVERVSFRFLRYGVFVEKGAGKPKGYKKGVESAKGNRAAAAAASGRTPKPWFNPVVDQELKKLADILQADIAEIADQHIRIK